LDIKKDVFNKNKYIDEKEKINSFNWIETLESN
jgi:hypothetical protein